MGARDNQHGCEGQSTWVRGTINMAARDNQHGCEGQSTWMRRAINMGARDNQHGCEGQSTWVQLLFCTYFLFFLFHCICIALIDLDFCLSNK
jgi:hypothetical protein